MSLALADVSEFQNVINWAAYGAANPAVIVRVHNSSRADLMAQQNIAGARRYCQFRGFYQYLTAGADPTAAAHAFQATVGSLGAGEVAILDLEEGAGDQNPRRAAWMAALQDPVEWTYSGLAFARAHLGDRVDWVAAYGQGEPTDPHLLWQNTDARSFAGIASPCDGSIFNGTIGQLMALTGEAVDMDATQDKRLTHIESMLSGLDFAINNGTPTPYAVRGELTSRLRTIDGHTIAQPVSADDIATATAAKVATSNVDSIVAGVLAGLPAMSTKEEVAAAVRAELVLNPLSLK